MKSLFLTILLVLLLHPSHGQKLTIPKLRSQLAKARHDYAKQANELALKEGNVKQIQLTLKTLITIEEDQKLYPDALVHLRQLTAMNDSLFTHKRSRIVAEAEANYQLIQKEQAIVLLQKGAALQQISLDKHKEELKIRQQQQLPLIMFALTLTLVVIGMLITSRRERVHNRLLAAQKAEIEDKANKLQQLIMLKDKLFTVIGHDLRAPVISLKNELHLISTQSRSTVTFTQWQNRMGTVTDALYTSLDNLLHWARLQQHDLQGIVQPVELSDVIKDVIELHTSLAYQKKIHLKLKAKPTFALADESFAQIVIRNILYNAIKFTPEGGIIHIHVQQVGQMAQVRIVDHGIGMEPIEPGHFQPITQKKTIGTNGEKGTGLGLLVCHEMMARNGGNMLIKSELGHGTTVTLSWPAVPTAQPKAMTKRPATGIVKESVSMSS